LPGPRRFILLSLITGNQYRLSTAVCQVLNVTKMLVFEYNSKILVVIITCELKNLFYGLCFHKYK